MARQIKYNFFSGFLVYIVGVSCSLIGILSYYKMDDLNSSILCFCAVQLVSSLFQSIVWTFSPFVVQVLLKYLKKETMKKNEDLVQKCKKCIYLFESLTLSFANFFVLYFTLIQFYTIFMTFMFIRSFQLYNTFNLNSVTFLIFYITSIATNIFWLITFTSSVDESNECIKFLGREIQEELLVTEGTQERRCLKYLRQMVNELKPMNASGYFTIDKTTLTSMLSVR